MGIEGSIYTECNSHLKETDKNRNQLVSIYIILIGLLISNYDKLSANKDIVLGIFSSIGLLVVISSIHYRKWHIIYTRTSQAVALYMLKDKLPEKDRINEIDLYLQSTSYMNNPLSWLNPLKSTEAAVYLLIVLATFIPIQLLLSEKGLVFFSKSMLLSFVIGVLIYYVLLTFFAFHLIRSSIKKSAFDEWILLPLKLALNDHEESSCVVPDSLSPRNE